MIGTCARDEMDVGEGRLTLTGSIVMMTSKGEDGTLLVSHTVALKVKTPFQLVAGVKVMLPAAVMVRDPAVTVPTSTVAVPGGVREKEAGDTAEMAVAHMWSGSLSTSVAGFVMFFEMGVSSGPEYGWGGLEGGSFTAGWVVGNRA
jgi:hypothetical protein